MRTRPVSTAQVRQYAGKAEEYATAATSELEQDRCIAATSLAIHAAINAADAVCGARLGHRAAGEDHDQVLNLLRQAGADGGAIESELRRLLPLKTKAEYDADDIAPSIAAKAVERAHRCIAVARRVANSIGSRTRKSDQTTWSGTLEVGDTGLEPMTSTV
jgi:uncharacterized protein YbjQ (UPF0145 family)